MDEPADTVVRILDSIIAIKDEAVTAWRNFDNATPSQLRSIVQLGDLSRELYFTLHQDEQDGC